MRRSRLLLVLCVGAVVGLTACGADASELAVSTDGTLSYDSRGDSAGVFGTIGAEQHGTDLCVFVRSTQGIGTGRVDLVFPAGYSGTRFGEVRDASGTVVAKRGDRVSVSVAPELTARLPAGCRDPGVGTARVLHIAR